MPRTRRRLAATVALVALGHVGQPVDGAGMNSHTMVGHRVAKYYGKVETARPERATLHNDAIKRNLAAVHAGSDFPDFLYACGKYADHHDAGEAAHWPPWQAAAAKYIRARPDFVSGNWTEDTEKLVAFLYGVSVHYVSDEFWEGLTPQLGSGQGFVRFLSSFNLNHTGTNDNDEGVANMAADFFVSWAMDEREIQPWRRYWPIREIADIYHSYNYSGQTFKDVTIASLEECRVIFDLGLWAEKEFGQFLFHVYSEYANRVPMVAERVVDIPIGGLDDMAVWSSWVWQRVARWLEEGPPDNPSPNLLARPVETTTTTPEPDHDEADQWIREFVQSLRELKEYADDLMPLAAVDLVERADAEDPLAGLLYKGPVHLRQPVERLLVQLAHLAGQGAGAGDDGRAALHRATHLVDRAVVRKDGAVERDSVEEGGRPEQIEEGKLPVGYHGSALVSGDFDGDGTSDLAVGAYGTGVPGSPQEGLVTVTYGPGRTAELKGPMTHARFGWELVVLDHNLDGIDDLVVAAPAASWDGALPISDATPAVRFWGRVYVFLGQKGVGLATSPSTVITTKDDITGLGTTLAAGDIDGDGHDDLLIGCPMSSFRADPSWSANDAIQRGALFAFVSKAAASASSQVELDARASADLRLEGLAGYSWFGQSAAVAVSNGRRMLLVGAPGHRADGSTSAVGRLHVFDLSKDSAGKVDARLAVTLTGEEIFAEFGHAIAVQPVPAGSAALVATASPAAGTAFFKRPRSGEVRLIGVDVLADLVAKATSEVLDVPVSHLPLKALLVGTSEGGGYGRLGWRMGFADVMGDQRPELVVAAPVQSGGLFHPGAREVGRLYVWDGAKLPTGTVTNLRRSAAWTVLGDRARGRLGSAFAAWDATGSRLLAVGSPRSDAAGAGGLEMAGRVGNYKVAAAVPEESMSVVI